MGPSQRHELIGIKRALRLEWMQKTAELMLVGLDAKTIRQELHAFLAARDRGGGVGGHRAGGARSVRTRTFIVNNLMRIWVSGDPELVPFREASLAFLRDNPSPSMALAVHWGMVSATYPFWFHAARQTGRLLALQNQATRAQIIHRLKEQYGDRQTVSHCARFVIRSFVAWGVLKDSKARGCYEKAAPVPITDRMADARNPGISLDTFASRGYVSAGGPGANLTVLLFEAALLATSGAEGALGVLSHNPAFFPFRLPVMTGDYVSQSSDRIDVVHYGLGDGLLRLKPR